MAISNITLSNSVTSIINPVSRTVVFSLIFCNLSEDEVEISAYVHPSTIASGESNKIINSFPIPAKDSLIWQSPEKFILDGGDTISAVADTADVIVVTVNHIGM